MSSSDPEYFERRAKAEIELARQATNGCVLQTYCELASAYLAKIYGENPAPEAAASAAAI